MPIFRGMALVLAAQAEAALFSSALRAASLRSGSRPKSALRHNQRSRLVLHRFQRCAAAPRESPRKGTEDTNPRFAESHIRPSGPLRRRRDTMPSESTSKPPTPPAAFRSALLFPEDANLKAYATPDSPSENPLNQPARSTTPPPSPRCRPGRGADTEGYKAGYAEGFAAGHASGPPSTAAAGYAEGFAAGWRVLTQPSDKQARRRRRGSDASTAAPRRRPSV